jgi:uncharacterized protein YbcI
MVRLYKDQFGRGPTRVRTSWAGPDTIVTVLEDSLTPVEVSLRDLGKEAELRNIRMLFQYSAEDEFRSVIETHTGRRVKSFISGLDARSDVSVELFVLEPEHPQDQNPQDSQPSK